ncbi:hypothetical protein LJC73_07070, partial [Bacteroidales bacterium OttesenSCG-928-L14]|nr:hypothetical protein [Bacteroidales bacterium OttesenSCG-928-L14]
ENREQIELAKFYEQLPKPTLIAIYEFLNEKLSAYYPEEEVPIAPLTSVDEENKEVKEKTEE